MSPIEIYPSLRQVHIGLALTSGTFFLVRGLASQAGARWPVAAVARRASMVIDTALLVAALGLLWVLHLNPFATAWLQSKLVLLVSYVVLGTFALKRARTRSARLLCFVAALACFAAMLAVARTHHPFAGLL
jgi:uncharacterized membrane protein SirB2